MPLTYLLAKLFQLSILKICKKLISFFSSSTAPVGRCAGSCSSQDKLDWTWIKLALSCLQQDFISLLVEGILPEAGQVINIIKVYLPMESITSDGFPIEAQK